MQLFGGWRQVAALAANNHKDFCSHVGQANIQTMACGGQPPVYKCVGGWGRGEVPTSVG